MTQNRIARAAALNAWALIAALGCSKQEPATVPTEAGVDATVDSADDIAAEETSADTGAAAETSLPDTEASDVSDATVGDTSDSSIEDTCTCATPPPPTCVDGATRRTYAATGSCGDGACSYATTNSTCPNGTVCKAGVCESPPSCAGGLTCLSGDSCCSTLLVPGGSFNRSYDGVTPEYSDPKWKATISPFRLDKYEITVGRFRKFVDAWTAGYRPAAGSGVHTHLRGGLGLDPLTGTRDGAVWADDGWLVSDASKIPATKTAFDTALNCEPTYGAVTWTASAGANENMPINCINWYEALAFCIWDGGFLPSEAEWNFAASGGSEHRPYPWGSAAPSTGPYAAYACNIKDPTSGSCRAAPVGAFPLGNGKYGHADLSGNLWEWTMETGSGMYDGAGAWLGYLSTSCNDCADLGSPGDDLAILVRRGGDFSGDAKAILVNARDELLRRNGTTISMGARCARVP
jgi:formylglycine-generating enzyme required for sulfatase activity